jgi:hypothetical protein
MSASGPGLRIERVQVVRLLLCAVSALVVIGGAVWLRGAARSACHVTSPLLNGIDLVEYGVVGLVVVAMVSALLEAVGAGWWVLPAALVVALAAAWVLLVRTQPAPDRPDTVRSCTHNLPAWWPAALPG